MATPTFVTNLSTLSLDEFSDNVERAFVTHMETIKPQARRLFILDPIGLNNGDTRTYNEYDGETFANLKAEGVDAAKARAGLGYEKSAQIRRFAKEIDVTWEMRNFNKVPQVVSKLKELREFIPQREELDLTHRVSFGTSSTYTDKDGQTITVTMGDGNPLFYATHALAGSSLTYRNRVSGDPIFSQGAFESAMDLAVTDVLSNLGERRVLNFSLIFSTDDTATCAEIRRFLKSQSDTTQNNSGVINPYMDVMEHVKLPYLATTATGARDATKRKWWGIVAPGMGGWNAYLGLAEAANLKAPVEDAHNDNWTLGVRGSYLICVVSGKGIIGSCPTSA
jgi:hypothetical protein